MKNIIISSIFLILLISAFSTIFAANTTTGNMMSNVGDTMQGVAENTRNTVSNMENGIENGAKNAKNTIMGATNNVQNGIENVSNNIGDTMMNGDYTAQRTAGDATVLGMSTNTWTWLILAIVGAAIVGLVWYYGAQYEHKNYDKD